MKISDIMSRDVKTVNPHTTLQQAARMMLHEDIGSLVVGENDKMVGVITDRDIVLRAVAEGRTLETTVGEIMSEKVCYCTEDDDLEAVASNMADIEKRRLPVVNSQKRLVGIVSLANIASARQSQVSGEVLRGVAKPH